MPGLPPLSRLQAEHNLSSDGIWDASAAHRGQVTGLLRAEARGAGRLAVLGAGNANDLDLPALLAVYRQVTLIDLDGEALRRGVGRQGVADHPGLVLRGGVDVCGIMAGLEGYTPGEPAASWAQRVGHARAVPVDVGGGGFDVVASTCLLSQLCGSVQRAVGEGSDRALELIQAVRLRHLLLLRELLVDGGRGLLVLDFVSSQTAPGLDRVSPDRLPGYLAEQIERRNFFTGLNPWVIEALFTEEPVLAAGVGGIGGAMPWVWDFGARRYAVTALAFTRVPSSGAG